jgi:hypothetical protein
MSFDNKSLNRFFLTKYDGDIQQTIDSLLNLVVDDPLTDQLRVLKEMGFTNEILNRSLLQSHNVDCDKVIELLTFQ